MIIRSFRNKLNVPVALASELLSPVIKCIVSLLCGRPTSSSAWRRGLLLGTSHIGDVLFRSGSIPQLNAVFPECKWYFLADYPASEILSTNPHIAGVISASDLRSSMVKWDVALCYDSSSYLPSLLTAIKLRIPNRIAYVHKGFSGLVTYPIPIKWPQPYACYFRDMVAYLAGNVCDGSVRPLIYPTPADMESARTMWLQNSMNCEEGMLAVFLTSRQSSGVLPSEKLAEVLAMIEQLTPKMQTIVLGAPSDRQHLEGLKTRFKLRASLITNLPLRVLYCFLGYARCVLTLDSGPRHMANAAGVPVIYYRNIAVHAIETGSYLETENDLCPIELSFIEPSKQASIFESIDPKMLAGEVITRIKLTE